MTNHHDQVPDDMQPMLPTSRTSIEVVVLAFLRERVHPEIEADTRLLEEGVIDSFGVVELITFLESEFEVSLDPRSVTAADVSSVLTIAATVERLLRADSV
jgi:acyl carrier protein